MNTKVLMVSPPSGGIDVYVNRLTESLRGLGVVVDIAGSREEESPFDETNERWRSSQAVIDTVYEIASRINFENYDVVCFNYGKNDVEQYLPVVLENTNRKIKNPVYFTHFLSRNLFAQYLHDNQAQQEAEKAIYSFFKNYLFFSSFARDYMEKQSKIKLSGVVSPLPETHSHEKLSNQEIEYFKKVFHFSGHTPTVYLPGFQANYKDTDFLLDAVCLVTGKIRLVIVGRGWRKKIGFNHKKIGKSEIYVLDKYPSSREYKFLSSHSAFGIFPYRQPGGDEIFQGSGTISNFIYEGKACVGLEEASIPEYIGNGGIVTQAGDVKSFAQAIDQIFVPGLRSKYESYARGQRERFSLDSHTKQVFSFINSLVR